jgi:hypothetical protein
MSSAYNNILVEGGKSHEEEDKFLNSRLLSLLEQVH